MAVYPERRVSSAAKWSRRLAVFAAALLVMSSYGHRAGMVETIGYFWVLGLVAVLAVTALVLAAVGFLRLWQFGDKGGRNSTNGVIIALLVLAPFAYAGFLFFSLPKLADISTDLVDPPVFFHAAKARTRQMNAIVPLAPETESLQIAFYPEITGRRYSLDSGELGEIVSSVLSEFGWFPLGVVRPTSLGAIVTVEVEARSYIVGLESDAAIRLTDEGETTYVDMRSASRYGQHDLGDNAAKIRRFFAALELEIAARSALVVPASK